MAIGDGNIPLKLDGEDKELVPTYRAAMGISKSFGGYMPAIQAVSQLDMEAIEKVLAFGLQLTNHGQKGIGEKIFKSNTPEVATACVKYINILMNGGKPVDESGPEDREEEGEA